MNKYSQYEINSQSKEKNYKKICIWNISLQDLYDKYIRYGHNFLKIKMLCFKIRQKKTTTIIIIIILNATFHHRELKRRSLIFMLETNNKSSDFMWFSLIEEKILIFVNNQQKKSAQISQFAIISNKRGRLSPFLIAK